MHYRGWLIPLWTESILQNPYHTLLTLYLAVFRWVICNMSPSFLQTGTVLACKHSSPHSMLNHVTNIKPILQSEPEFRPAMSEVVQDLLDMIRREPRGSGSSEDWPVKLRFSEFIINETAMGAHTSCDCYNQDDASLLKRPQMMLQTNTTKVPHPNGVLTAINYRQSWMRTVNISVFNLLWSFDYLFWLVQWCLCCINELTQLFVTKFLIVKHFSVVYFLMPWELNWFLPIQLFKCNDLFHHKYLKMICKAQIAHCLIWFSRHHLNKLIYKFGSVKTSC